MSKRTAALVLAVGLLSSSVVAEGESFLGNSPRYDGSPFSVSTFKETCLSHFDPVSCQYLDLLRYRTTDSKSTKTVETNPDNRTTEGISQEEVSIEVPIVDLENNHHKRFSVFRRKNPTGRGYKRGPGFRSWGGKRDFTLSEENRDKKSKFASWGGKRDGEVFPDEAEPDKRARFQNWGGKRTGDDSRSEPEKRWPSWKGRRLYLNEPFINHVPKRPQFQSWGGKRGSDPWRDFFRFFHLPQRYHLNGGEKRVFSSWGGKRFDGAIQFGEPRWNNVKGRVFQNWGGKRAPYGESPETTESGKENPKGGPNEGEEPRFEEGEEEGGKYRR